ncbi:MAG: Fpg/Nei family DNA glycosylase [Actinomycetes bacterium]
MPEGDTVWLTAKILHDALAGQRVLHSDFRVPQLATADLSGTAVRDVVARGKHILARFDSGLSLHSHLRMDGSWRVARGRRPAGGPVHSIRVVLTTAEHVAIGYRVHDLAIVRTEDEGSLVGHLGPDLLGEDWDEHEAVRRLLSAPDRTIGETLLDQRNLAGIGNLYKAEVLFLSGIHPWAKVGAVADLGAVVRRARALLHANKNMWRQVTTGNTRKGGELYVFERPRLPCRRCGTPIRVAMQGKPPYDRLTYWCPSCQPSR